MNVKSLLIAIAACVALAGVSSAERSAVDKYAALLERFVDDDGLVDYAGLRRAQKDVDEVCALFPQADLETSTTVANQRVAYWLNVYNAFALKLVVDNYPIQPSEGKTKYPANSIRQIPGAWEHTKFPSRLGEVSLDEVEHKVLRAQFKEPRIHMALVCASMSSPKLRREPYDARKLDKQLDDQAREFLSDLRKFHIDREAGEVWVSPLFDWFVDDFLPDATKKYPRPLAQQKSLTAFASKYLSAEDAKYLQEGKYVVMYFEYDWTLNEQPK
jgi:hypothetical protein